MSKPPFSRKQINQQHDLVYRLGELESLIEVCRRNQDLQELSEGAAIRDVLMMATNKANDLVSQQREILDVMEAADSQGGES